MRVAPAVVAAIFGLALPATALAVPSAEQLGSQLQPLRDADRADLREAERAGLELDSRRVLVDVYVEGDPAGAAPRLRELGMEVIATGTEPLAVVEGYLPVEAITAAARLGVSSAVLPVIEPIAEAGAVTSQGVASHNLPAAISASGASGAGVDVGVISDSIDRVAGGVDASQASGDLPPDPRVQVLLDDADPESSDEGRAMAEIIYDEAPALSRILFHTGFLGAASKANGIDTLVLQGADVIADDITYLSEPFFQDGQISIAADRAKAAGVAYFVSAGNRARQSYESGYRDGGSGGLHDFDPGGPVDTCAKLSAPIPGSPTVRGNIRFFLQWDEAFGAATTDLDIRLMDETCAAPLPMATQGTTNNIETKIPLEFASFTNTTGAPVSAAVQITRTAGTREPFMKWVEADNDGIHNSPAPETYDTASSTINPEAASARGTMTVGAVRASDPGLDSPEPFTSRGPVVRLFDSTGARLATPETRAKPNLAAADGVATTVPGFTFFLGTSASAPSAAGIAAILRSANPNATVNEVYAQMSDPANAIDCSGSSLIPDPDCGAGFILADRAVAGLDRTPLAPVRATQPAEPNGRAGWFTTETVGLSWSTADPESPTESTSGCDPVTVTMEGQPTFTCSGTSGGGLGSNTTTIKHDTERPRKPKFRGIRAGRTYSPAQLPSKRSVKKCKSRDRTSGIRTCKVRGYSAAPGRHTLKATATDFAGLRSKSSLSYRVR